MRSSTCQPVRPSATKLISFYLFISVVDEYEPQVVEVDVHVAKPISSHLSALGRLDEHHQVVTVPASQYNTILRSMNSHLVGDVNALPYIKDGIHIPFLGKEETPGTGVPIPHAQIMGYGGATISRKVTTDDAISQHHISTTRALASIHETARSIHDGSLINAGGSIIHQTTASITHGSMKLHGNSQSVVEGSKANKSVARSIHTATESFGPSHAVEKKKRACAC